MTDEEKNDLVTRLKSRSYIDALGTILNDLSLSAKTSYAEMEALLIFMIYKTHGSNLAADIVLMALGLLAGFNNREEREEASQERDAYAERRERFLQETNYISIKYRDKFGAYKFSAYEKAKQDVRSKRKDGTVQTELDTIRSTLDTSTSRYLGKVISLLYKEKDSIGDYLNAAKSACEETAKEKHIYPIRWEKHEHIPDAILPDAKTVKLSKNQAQPDGKNTVQPPQSVRYPAPVEPTDKPLNDCVLLRRVFVTVLIVCAIMFLLFGEAHISGGQNDNGYKIGGGYNGDGSEIGEAQSGFENQTTWRDWGLSYRGPFAGENNK